MREINVIFETAPYYNRWLVEGHCFSFDNGGKTIVPMTCYGVEKTKQAAEALARRGTINLYDAADWDNRRFDVAKAYLARRAERSARPVPQLALEF